MPTSPPTHFDVVVVGAGPAGVIAALRAARLGATTALITQDEFGGMAANDGPVPVRTLAQAARLIREARQLPRYGITGAEPSLDYPALLARVAEVTEDARRRSLLREDLERVGVTVHERAGSARFLDSHTIASVSLGPVHADKIILCPGGRSRRLEVPGFELTATHSDAWHLTSVPRSLLVIGAGATGVQVASIFNAFGSKVQLVEAAPRILMTEDEDVSRAVAAALRASGVDIEEGVGRIEHFEPSPTGVRLVTSTGAGEWSAEATLAVVAVGWVAATSGMDLGAAGVQADQRGYIQVDDELRTSAHHVFAAGDVTGRAMLVHEAVREGLVASTNAVLEAGATLPHQASPIGSFTDPEYASVGLTEASAREDRELVVSTQSFDSMPRPIIDGREVGFCKLLVDRDTQAILGCHIVGERAVELAQLAAVAMAAAMPVQQLAMVAFSFPTYANALGRAAIGASTELDQSGVWASEHLVSAEGVAA